MGIYKKDNVKYIRYISIDGSLTSICSMERELIELRIDKIVKLLKMCEESEGENNMLK